MNSLLDWYSGKNVLVTGATGFMGLVLVEKLLRSIPDIGEIYIIIRAKNALTPTERLEKYIKFPVFDRLRSRPEQLAKIRCVSGDILDRELGLSDANLHLLRHNCHVVFHMAACVRFDQPLKSALATNVGGCLHMLELAVQLEQLLSYVHVSTAYCHPDEPVVREVLYPGPHPPRKVLELAEWLDETVLDAMTERLLGSSPNTYAYTKCLSERLVGEYSDRLPVVLARPSIVTAAHREPLPGWVQNLNGPTGLLVGAGKGAIRSMLCNEHYQADVVPVDVAINALIVSAWETGRRNRRDPAITVLNVCRAEENSLTWGECVQSGRKHILQNPFSLSLWYPGGTIKTNYYHHMFCVIFFHFLPAYLIDFILPMFSQKPFLIQTQKRISSGLRVLQYYTIRDWRFSADRLKQISAELSAEEREIFYTDTNEINWDEYIRQFILGARKYCLKEDPATIPKARRTLRMLYCLDVSLKMVFWASLMWICMKLFLALFNP